MFQGHPRTTTTQWKKLRLYVLARDHYVCHVCGQLGADQVDHLTPWARGGTDHPSNLAAIHDRPCHRTKTSLEGVNARRHHERNRPDVPHPGLRPHRVAGDER